MPAKLFWISMTTELWCLVAAELALNICAILVWRNHRRAPNPRHKTYLIAIQVAVPLAAILAVGAGVLRALFPAAGPPSETARDLAIGILTIMHGVYLWIPAMIIPMLADARVQSPPRPAA